MDTLIELFNLGMYRDHSELLPNRKGCVLNLGAGKKHIHGTFPIDYPEWDAEVDPIPYQTDSVDMIHCYHLLEHVANTYWVLGEIERVLKPGAHVNIVVPYYSSNIMAQDPDHKTAFSEHSWRTIFDVDRYTKGKVRPMYIGANFIMGDEEKNIVLITQLVKI